MKTEDLLIPGALLAAAFLWKPNLNLAWNTPINIEPDIPQIYDILPPIHEVIQPIVSTGEKIIPAIKNELTYLVTPVSEAVKGLGRGIVKPLIVWGKNGREVIYPSSGGGGAR